MLRAVFLLLLASFARAAQETAPASAPATRLEALFSAAANDPAAVVPLILESSAQLSVLDGDRGHALADRLEPFCRRAFFSPEILPDMERLGLRQRKVRDGELPSRIARECEIGHGLFRLLNANYDERRLRVGQVLKVLDLSAGGAQILIDKARYRLAVWRTLPDSADGQALVMYVPVGLGAPDSPTPSGRTHIVERTLDPSWTHPVTKQVFPPGDPGNVLGGYWIELDPAGLGGRTGIGLHGFTGEMSEHWIEQPASHGCVRMLQPDIDRVFHLALEGTPVAIVP